MMRAVLKSTLQMDVHRTKRRENGKNIAQRVAKHTHKHTQTRHFKFCYLTREMRYAKRATRHGEAIVRVHRCTYSAAHACTHVYVHTCNTTHGTIRAARQRTMKLRPWYRFLPVVLSAVDATHSRQVHFPAQMAAKGIEWHIFARAMQPTVQYCSQPLEATRRNRATTQTDVQAAARRKCE